jgi:hypothetical protein
MTEQAAPNIGRDLRRIHRAITRGLAVLTEAGPGYAAGSFHGGTTREGFWKYCQGLEANLHSHHLTEDDLFFPYAGALVPQADVELLRAEHAGMTELLGAVRSAREAGSAAALLPPLGRLAALWRMHIAREEAWFSPEVMGRVMTVPEHIELAQRLAAHSAAHAEPAPLSVPFVLYNLEGEDRAHFLRVMPAEVTQHLVPVVWQAEWAPMRPFLLP